MARIKKYDAVKEARKNWLSASKDLNRMERLYMIKKNLDETYGEQIRDLDRLIAEMEKSIVELPDGSLKDASIERRDELMLRRNSIKVKYPRHAEMSYSDFEKIIAIYTSSKAQTAKILEETIARQKVKAEAAAKKAAEEQKARDGEKKE